MTVPSLFLGILISSAIGTLFHLIRGGGPGRLLLYLFLAWLGFWGGHTLSIHWDFTIFSLGPLRLGMAIVGTVLTLGIGYWLSLIEITEPE